MKLHQSEPCRRNFVKVCIINCKIINIKNLKTFTGYVQLKLSSFRLSSYNLQWIKTEKMTTTINTKIGETINEKNLLKHGRNI